jgi:hypothetical protein
MHVLSAIGPRNSSQIFLISSHAVAVFSLATFDCYGASRSKRLLEDHRQMPSVPDSKATMPEIWQAALAA